MYHARLSCVSEPKVYVSTPNSSSGRSLRIFARASLGSMSSRTSCLSSMNWRPSGSSQPSSEMGSTAMPWRSAWLSSRRATLLLTESFDAKKNTNEEPLTLAASSSFHSWESVRPSSNHMRQPIDSSRSSHASTRTRSTCEYETNA